MPAENQRLPIADPGYMQTIGVRLRNRNATIRNRIADEFAHQININRVSQRGIVWEPADKSAGSRVRRWTKIRGMLHATIPPANGGRENAGLFITRIVST